MKRAKSFFKWLFGNKIRIGILIILLLIAGYFAFQQYNTKNAAPQYQTSQVEKGTLVTSVSSSGTISSGNSINITTQASGIVSNVYVQNGDTVVQGQKIADVTLDLDSQARAASSWTAYQSALTSLKNAQNSQRATQASLEKVLDDIHLNQYGNGGYGNVGTSNETETQKNERTTAQVNEDKAFDGVNQSQVAVSSAWLSYAQSSPTITAPQSGVIKNLIITPGLQVAGGTSTTNSAVSSQKIGSITVGQGSIQSSVNLSEIDVTKVSPGQKVSLSLAAFPDKTFTGQVLAIDTNGTVSSGVTTYSATISLDSAPENVYPNMAVTAKIITNVKSDVLLVPTSALQTASGASSVRVLKNGQVQTINVEIGDSNDTQTEITSGLTEGDMVVTGQTSTGTIRATGATTSPFGGLNRGFGGGGGGAARVGR